MTPFQQFRVWLRRASVGERAGAGLTAAVALALLVYLFVPPNGGGTGSVQAGGALGPVVTASEGPQSSGAAGSGVPGAGVSGAGASGGAGASTGPQDTAAGSVTALSSGGSGGSGSAAPGSERGTGGPSSQTGLARPSAGSGPAGPSTETGSAGRCLSPPDSDQGISASQIKVAITLNEIVGPAGNATYGLASPQEQQEDYQQVIDAINASGGAACRKLVPLFYTGNSADQGGLEQICLEIAQAGVLMEIDSGAYYGFPSLADCFPQHHIPFISTAWIPQSQNDQFYPYMFPQASMEVNYRNTVFALHQLGFFSPAKGFTKLGVLYRDCVPILGELTSWLGQVGVPGSEVVTYDVGCPAAFATPADLEQAVLKFQQAGVHNVTELEEYTDFSNFTTVAQQQGFRPQYGLPDDGILAISYGSQHPDYSNIANAVAITPGRWGEEDIPGYVPSAATARCNAIYAAHGRPPVYKQPDGTGGTSCNQLWQAVAAIDHAPALERDALAAGLQAAKSVDFSYPDGPNDFSGPRETYGDEFWRPDQYFTSCNCWRMTDTNFHPSFP